MENKAALAETVRTSMERHHVPGVAVGFYDGEEEYAGRYVVGGTGDSVELRIEGSALRFEAAYGDHSAISETNLEAPPPARAAFYARDRMVLIDGPYKGERAEFLRSPEGEIRWLRMGRIYAPQGRPTPRDEL
jgi:hypothetical protein